MGVEPNRPNFDASWRTVLLRDPCVYCGGQATGLDHIHPRSHGGSDGWENRAPSCAECDRAKAHYPLIGFLLGEKIAAAKVARRRHRYRDASARRAALVMIRRRIAQEFYRSQMIAAFGAAGVTAPVDSPSDIGARC